MTSDLDTFFFLFPTIHILNTIIIIMYNYCYYSNNSMCVAILQMFCISLTIFALLICSDEYFFLIMTFIVFLIGCLFVFGIFYYFCFVFYIIYTVFLLSLFI